MALIRTLSLTVALGLVAGVTLADTLGGAMSSGRMSEAAAAQFVAGSGYSVDEARGMSINSIAERKWKDD